MGRKSSNKKRARERYFPDEEKEKRQVYTVLGLAFPAIALAIWGVRLNDEMLIPDGAIWLTVLVGAVIATTIIYLAWRRMIAGWEMHWVKDIALVFFFGSLIGGPIGFFAISATNYYSEGDGVTETVTLDVIGTGKNFKRRSKECAHTYVKVKLKDIKYTVNFSCEFEYSIGNYKKVELTLTKSGLGYYMIVEKFLIRDEE